MQIRDYLEKRWSPRAFADKEISQTMLQEMFAAAKQAASSNNEQPWRFLVGVKGTKSYDLIFDTLVDFNKAWCKTAPVLVVGVSKKTFTKNGEQNAHCEYDLGTAVAQFTMKAFDLNVFVHQMAGFDSKLVENNFNIPEDYKAVVAFAAGHIGNKDQLPEKIAAMESPISERKKLSELVFEENWGESIF